jgi:D-methionine transport system substrate-binding protein
MRTILATVLLATLPLISFAETIKIGATPVPQAEILEFAKPLLAKEGVDLNILVFNDYVQPNVQVNEKELDANFFQHKPYLDEFNSSHKMNLVSVGGVHVEPMAAYSKTITDIKQLKDGAKVAIPNDVTNGGRALILLANHGIITLKDPKNVLTTVADVTENPKKLVFLELEAAMLPRTVDEVDVAIINTNYAIDAGFNPLKDSLLLEGAESPYANLIVVREENKALPKFEKLIKVLHSDEMKTFLKEHYKGALIPAF